MKKAIFTVLIGDYDHLVQAPKQNGWDCILVTDQEFEDSKGWEVFHVSGYLDEKLHSRYYKIMSHHVLDQYDLVCYIDANYTIVGKLPERPMRFKHLKRSTVDEELDRLSGTTKETPFNLECVSRYAKLMDFKDDKGLFQNGFFIRKHDEETNKLHDVWWSIVSRFSHRDQLSLPIASHKLDMELEGETNRYFKRVRNHK